MSILSDFEDRIGGAVEGLFAGAFRSPVQPSEIAKALAKSMDDGRMVGIGKVYAPVTYTVALSTQDSEKMSGFLPVLAGELSTYLTDHAREDAYHLTAKPVIKFVVHEDLKLGRFRVSADLAYSEELPKGPPLPPDLSSPAPLGVYDYEAEAAGAQIDTITVGDTNHDVALRGDRLVIGRLADCDICLSDANASRRHAEIVRVDDDWYVVDLGSTNGTSVNGQRIERVRLDDGDTIEIGATRLTYHRHGA
jgi:hypothetical protein